LLDRRKTALYRALEALLGAQAGYLRSGDPDRRQPLTQRSLAVAIGVEASALNRLLSNKAVELPWGVEAPLKSLLPSAKSLALGKLETLARASPSASDESLRRALADRHRVYLSRRSVAQYRMDCGLSKRRRRA
jgi:DNA-directed RNA polymerase specialized sigma54-like protein